MINLSYFPLARASVFLQVVTPGFLRGHAATLAEARVADGDDRAFTYGRVVNTANEEDPTSEPFKVGVCVCGCVCFRGVFGEGGPSPTGAS